VPYPPAADLKVEAVPVTAPAIATSEQAYEDYNGAVAAWRNHGWAAVARLCRYSKATGMAIDCPEAEHAVARPAGS
jgi:hypothetical protein